MESVLENEEAKVPISKDSQTASEFIDQQLALEADAREALPYKFDKCTNALGPLRQTIFACLTCSPPPASPAQVYTPAGVCYGCSISCHGEHTLVELFSRRNFVCDCGTSRLPSTSSCTLRSDPVTGKRGVHSQEPHKGNNYNQNFQNHFCACGEEYDAETEKGTMFQCLGLGTVETGGCGEDWYHPECLMGLSRDWHASSKGGNEEKQAEAPKQEEQKGGEGEDYEPSHPLPPGFPREDDFESLLCYKCVESNPWIKKYAGTPGFLPPVYRKSTSGAVEKTQNSKSEDATVLTSALSLKRKASDSDDLDMQPSSPSKRVKDDEAIPSYTAQEPPASATHATDSSEPPPPGHKHTLLPSNPPTGTFNLFLRPDFRDHLCHCPSCFPDLIPHPQLIDDEETYEPSLSNSSAPPSLHPSLPGAAPRSQHSGGSLYDRGEAALSNIDRVRAIEGVMAYNHLRDKVKAFLKPYAEEGRVVSAEDIKTYFETLRGDKEGMERARGEAGADGGGGGGGGGNADGDKDAGKDGSGRKEQSGY